MTANVDRVVLNAMRFDVRLGVTDEEREGVQPIEVDLEMTHDLAEAGRSDDLTATIDYGHVFELCRDLLEAGEFRLIEAVAERLAAEVLAKTPAAQVVVRVRKLRVPVDGRLDYAAVEITRRPSG